MGSYIWKCIDFLQHAPNIERLYAPGSTIYECILSENDQTINSAWALSMSTLKSLALRSLAHGQLNGILNSCPILEELECYSWFPSQSELVPFDSTLKRLCCLDTPRARSKSADGRFWTWYQSMLLAQRNGLDFSQFLRLEVLEIDQLLAYAPLFEFDELVARRVFDIKLNTSGPPFSQLPSSLRVLQISNVMLPHELCRYLRHLHHSLSRLSSLDVIRITPGNDLSKDSIDEFTALVLTADVKFHCE
jgi:hypothetical protein